MGSLTKDFSAWEFRCRCMACGFRDGLAINRELVEKLQTLRNIYGKAMSVNSGIRCEKHNKFVGGKTFSKHLPSQGCRAADIRISSRAGRVIIVREALQLGLSVGLNNSFIHLDNRRGAQAIFTY